MICPICKSTAVNTYRHPGAKIWCTNCQYVIRYEGDITSPYVINNQQKETQPMSNTTTPILMSAENPNGWTLEALLRQLQLELMQKTTKIINDVSDASRTVRHNNYDLIRLLQECEGYQRDNIITLNNIRPNEGPLGRPRIGE